MNIYFDQLSCSAKARVQQRPITARRYKFRSDDRVLFNCRQADRTRKKIEYSHARSRLKL